MMRVNIRLSGELAALAGRHRFSVTVADGATVGDLVDLLRREYPKTVSRLETAVPIIAGRHVTQSEPLADGQEVAFLLPIAGG
jgi:molybdopterin converting factor small subunit